MTVATPTKRQANAEMRQINSEVRKLRTERKRWLSGQMLADLGWWGMPWCGGPGSEHHLELMCEGCATVAYSGDRADEVSLRIETLTARLNPFEGEVVPNHVGPQQMAMF